MCKLQQETRHGKDFSFFLEKLPFLDIVKKYFEKDGFPCGIFQNKQYYECVVRFED